MPTFGGDWGLLLRIVMTILRPANWKVHFPYVDMCLCSVCTLCDQKYGNEAWWPTGSRLSEGVLRNKLQFL